MKRNVRLAVAMVFLSGAAFAQSTYSTIYGSITDPSAAVIRDAMFRPLHQHWGGAVCQDQRRGAIQLCRP